MTNQEKKAIMADWLHQLAGYLVKAVPYADLLKLKVGNRQVDMWPLSGNFKVNEGPTLWADTPSELLTLVNAMPDVGPEFTHPYSHHLVEHVVQFIRFEYGPDTVFDQANAWLMEHNEAEFVDFRVIPVERDAGTYGATDHEEVLILVCKIPRA